MSFATPGKNEFAFCGELLDSMVGELAYVDMAAGIGGNTHGRREFSLLTTMTSPRKEELAFWSESLHAVQFEVRNINVSLGSDGDIQRLLELAGITAALPEGTQRLAGRGKHLHAAGAGVGDKHLAFVAHGDALRLFQFLGPRARPIPFGCHFIARFQRRGQCSAGGPAENYQRWNGESQTAI